MSSDFETELACSLTLSNYMVDPGSGTWSGRFVDSGTQEKLPRI